MEPPELQTSLRTPASDTAVLDIGRVMGHGFSITFRSFIPFFLVSLIFLLPAFAVQYLVTITEVPGSEPIILAVAMLSYSLIVAALVYGTIQRLRGHRVGIGDSLGRGIVVIGPVFGVALVMTVALGVGLLLVVVGFFVFLTMLWVAIPVAVVERPGVMASLKRSLYLTKGNRWRIFALFLLVAIAQSMIGFGVLLVLGGVMAVGGAALGGAGLVGTAVLFIVGSVLMNAFFSIMYAVIIAITYFDLRNLKEGAGLEEIASVFD